MDVKVSEVSYLLDRYKHSYLLRKSLTLFGFEEGKDELLLLSQVNLRIKPGHVMVLTGIGIGHKCLLECIAVRQREGLMSGKILYDGAVRRNGIFKDIVLIHDLGVSHFGSLTVFEYLFYGARLRIYHEVLECRERARQAAQVVGLDQHRTISSLNKSELRILDIAVELVSNPSLICLIDPTEGLDAAGKLQVMRVLYSIAKRVSRNTTIIYNCSSFNEEMQRFINQIAIFSGNELKFASSMDRFFLRSNNPLYPLPSSSSSSSTIINPDHLAHLWKQISLVVTHYFDCATQEELFSPSHIHSNALQDIVLKFHEFFQSLSSSSANGTTTIASYRNGGGATTNNNLMEDAEYYNPYDQQPRLSRTITRDEFFSARRRLGESGTNQRYKKTLWKEVSILIRRSVKYHVKNVSCSCIVFNIFHLRSINTLFEILYREFIYE
jgi:ABC-type multidrug transport system ATPase subunit